MSEQQDDRKVIEDLQQSLADTLSMLRAAHMQCGVHHDSIKRVIKARALLASVKLSFPTGAGS